MTYEFLLLWIFLVVLIADWLSSRGWRHAPYLPCTEEELPNELRELVTATAGERTTLRFGKVYSFRRVLGDEGLWVALAFNQDARVVLVYGLSQSASGSQMVRSGVPHFGPPEMVSRHYILGFESHVGSRRLITVNPLGGHSETLELLRFGTIRQELDTISSITSAWRTHQERLGTLPGAVADIRHTAQTEGLRLLQRKVVPLP